MWHKSETKDKEEEPLNYKPISLTLVVTNLCIILKKMDGLVWIQKEKSVTTLLSLCTWMLDMLQLKHIWVEYKNLYLK